MIEQRGPTGTRLAFVVPFTVSIMPSDRYRTVFTARGVLAQGAGTTDTPAAGPSETQRTA